MCSDLHFQSVPVKLSQKEKQELMKMRTLERRAKMSELQRLRKAQVSNNTLFKIHFPIYPGLGPSGYHVSYTKDVS